MLSQKSEYWSWNYWKRDSEDAINFPYPDDLDDTFCALATLAHYDKRMITGDIFAHIVKLCSFVDKKLTKLPSRCCKEANCCIPLLITWDKGKVFIYFFLIFN